jgi:excisionase family DNA binding protein
MEPNRPKVVSMAHEEELLTVKDVQRICKIGRTTAYDLIATKQVRAVRINRVLRIRRSDLEQYLRANECFPTEQW